jgi:hypothetical protein
MGWLERKKKSRSLPLVFVDQAAVAAYQRKLDEAELTFLGVEWTGENTYRTFRGNDVEKAKAFLRNEPVNEEFHYIVVKTPDGTWGTDIEGIYLEKLRPWQLRTDDADCTGTITLLIDGYFNLQAAAQGISDNYVVEVTCGDCAGEWIDAVRYRDLTLVRCPRCGAANRVDSSNIKVMGYG